MGNTTRTDEDELYEHLEHCNSCQLTIERLTNTSQQELSLLLRPTMDSSNLLDDRLENLKQARPPGPINKTSQRIGPSNKGSVQFDPQNETSSKQNRFLLLSILFLVASVSIASLVFFNAIFTQEIRHASSADELLEYLNQAQSQPIIIEVESNKIYTLEPIVIDAQQLEIRASDNNKAKFVFPIAFNQNGIKITNGRITLSGLEIEYSPGLDEPSGDPDALICCENSEVSIDNCTLLSYGKFCIESIESRLSISNSNLSSEIESIIYHADDSTTLDVISSKITAECAVSIKQSNAGKIVMENSKIVTDFAIDIPFINHPEKPFHINAKYCEFICETATLSVSHTDADTIKNAKLPTLLFEWVGDHNKVTNKSIILTSDQDDAMTKVTRLQW